MTGRAAPSPVEPSPAHEKWRCGLADRFAGKDPRPAGMRGPIGRAPARWRLSPLFVEWMMGLPDGWVTAETVEQWRARLADRRAQLDPRPAGMRGSVARYLPIPRNAQLKALGNGVVWQQGAAALRLLLAAKPLELVHHN